MGTTKQKPVDVSQLFDQFIGGALIFQMLNLMTMPDIYLGSLEELKRNATASSSAEAAKLAFFAIPGIGQIMGIWASMEGSTAGNNLDERGIPSEGPSISGDTRAALTGASAVVLGAPLAVLGNWAVKAIVNEISGAGTTALYRAVADAEMESINATNAFSNPAGIEAKYFSTSADGAASYAKQTVGTGLYQGPYTIVKTSIPSELITDQMTATVDRGISTVVVPTEMLPSLSTPVPLNYSPVPR